jgi:hypothetical protein
LGKQQWAILLPLSSAQTPSLTVVGPSVLNSENDSIRTPHLLPKHHPFSLQKEMSLKKEYSGDMPGGET